MPFAQLCVTHDLVIIRSAVQLPPGSFQSEPKWSLCPVKGVGEKGGIVDNRQWIFDLVRELSGESSGHAQLHLADGEFAGFFSGEALAIRADLNDVAAEGHQEEQSQAGAEAVRRVGEAYNSRIALSVGFRWYR